MSDHRFALGQTVRLVRGYAFHADRSGKYRVTRLLPYDGKQVRYCLEHPEFLFSQLAMEGELIGVLPSVWQVRPETGSSAGSAR
jgi:hypothetical protein